jgi:hypothetical protein
MKKVIANFMAVFMLISTLPTLVYAAEFSDMPSDWSTEALERAVVHNLLQGDKGNIMPNKFLTRAQMATIINRAFAAKSGSSLEDYTDVSKYAWYYEEMEKAVQMGTFVGESNKLHPDSYITRQDAFLVLARSLKLTYADVSVLNQFQDKNNISSWAISAVSALTDEGYINGTNGYLNPQSYITRAEFAKLMDNIIQEYISKKGTYTSVAKGNIMINVPDVTLKDLTVNGDLIIGDGVGDGDISLDNVKVAGRLVVRGGGINSIHITGQSNLQKIIVARVDGQVRVYAEEGTEIGDVLVDGKDDVTIEGNAHTVLLLADNVTVTSKAKIIEAKIEGDHSKIIVASGSTVNKMTVQSSNVEVEVEGTVKDITANGTEASISGNGSVNKVQANANDIKVTTSHTLVTASEGTSGVIAGTKTVSEGDTKNTTTTTSSGGSSGGSSSQSDVTAPTNASGYPKADTATGTGFTVRAKINEAGTVYYVVVADGAAAPTTAEVKAGTASGGVAALKSGSIALTANTEGTSAVTGLSGGTAYDVYVVAQDSSANLQASATKVDIATSSSIPSSLTVAITGDWAPYDEAGSYSKLEDDYNSTGRPRYRMITGLDTYYMYWLSDQWILKDSFGTLHTNSDTSIAPPKTGWDATDPPLNNTQATISY